MVANKKKPERRIVNSLTHQRFQYLNINLNNSLTNPINNSSNSNKSNMAFKTTSFNNSDDGSRELTLKEFKKWLMRFDTDKDGRISKTELREIVKATGGWFSGWKGKAGIRSADKNRNGFVDECEIENLIQFAQKELGVRIVAK